MSKKTDVRNRIKKVMAGLGIDNQSAFAKMLGFQPTTLSAWMTGASLPSPDAYMVLGRKAPSIEDSLFFWEKAGLTRDAILSAAAKIERERGRDVASEIAAGDAVIIAPLAEFNDGSMTDLVLPRRCVPNATSVRYLIVNQGFEYASGPPPPFEIGDILLVDVSHSDSIDLMPFWGETVLFCGGLERGGYMVGQLELYPFPHLSFLAKLHLWTTFKGGETLPIAPWRAEMPAGASSHDGFSEEVEAEAEARARKEFRLANGLRILGIVRGWLSLAGSGEKNNE
jgi:hypothetical protein